MSEISKLTSAQIARLHEFRKKWFSIALSTDPADRLLAQDGVKQAYEAAKLDPPGMFIWLRSPLEGVLAAALCELWTPSTVLVRTPIADRLKNKVWGSVETKVGNQLLRRVKKQVWDDVTGKAYTEFRRMLAIPVWSHVWAELGDLISNEIGPHITAPVETQLADSVLGTQLLYRVCDQFKSQFRAHVGIEVGAQPSARLWNKIIHQFWFGLRDSQCLGQYDAGSLSFYDYFRTACGVVAADRLAGLIQIAKSCGWWWPYRGVVILTERPCRLFRDSGGRLHNENALALEYPDGWGVYAIHGISVPKKYIETPADLIDPGKVLRMTNAASRAAVISKIGFQRLMKKMKYKVISKANGNSLIEFDLGNVRVRALHLVWIDKYSRKETVLPVPRTLEEFDSHYPDNINDCEQVRRWTLGWSEDADIGAET